jgi:hypothetical protein
MLRRHLTLVAALIGAATSFGQSSLFKVDIATRSSGAPQELSDAAYNLYQQNFWSLSYQSRRVRELHGISKAKTPFLAPAIIRMTRGSQVLSTGGRTRGNGITLAIDPTFNTATDTTRVAFMQSVYDTAKPTIEAVFGDAAITGTVNVVNADATIGDRNAITGGYYLPNNGSGGREIRLPLNASREVAAVALIHCLLLAYLPDPAYSFDGYLEGLVRAATQKIVRLPASLPAGLDQQIIESVLEQTYEIGAGYDWANQKSLGGPRFIAPNLLTTPIVQGTRGGLFFQRYQMSGSVWEKVLTEYPTFIKDLNLLLRSNPGAATDANQLESLAASVVGAGSIEGDTFQSWVRKQFILDTRLNVGTKLHSLITPITSGLAGTDFGVFNIEATLFSTDASGNETLLSSTGYPVYWDKSYNRILAASQDELLDIAASYGSVSPNFTNDNAGTPYRVAVDIPIQDRIVRQYVPAGSIATPASTTVSDFYGTVVGVAVPVGTSLIVRVQNGSDTFDAPVSNYAFGLKVGTPNFLASRSLTVKLIRKSSTGVEVILLTRIIDKGPGPLGIQLGNEPVVTTGFPSGLSAGVQMIGFTGDPVYSGLESILGLNSSNFLAARFNSAKTNYDLYPNSGSVLGGQAYFVRVPASLSPTWAARVESGTAVAVALRPGWNMVTCPLGVSTPFANVSVVHTIEFPRTYLGASGNDANDTAAPLLGKDAFQFVPGANDAFSGVPEGGSFQPITSFEPGVGYFVRCLAPEGAVILFRPPTGQSFVSQNLAVNQFMMQVKVYRQGEASVANLGMAAGATSAFDARFDSNLPPGIGGLQVAVQNNDLRYTDIRAISPQEIYRVNASGCEVGKKYAFSFNTLKGRAVQIQVKDLQTYKTQVYGTTFGSFVFTATKTTMSFDVMVKGVK